MSYKDLRDYINFLEGKNDLVRISHPVSPYLELTEISRRVLAHNGPALYFDNVVNSDGSPNNYKIIANLFGSTRRVAWGMNQELKDLRKFGEFLAFLRQPTPPDGIKEALAMAPILKKILTMNPKQVKKAPCQEIILTGEDIDLYQLPIQTCWPEDVAPLVTWPLVVTGGVGNDKSDNYNLGIYRMQLVGKNKLIMRWLKHRGGAQHFAKWKKAGLGSMPVAAVIGADPGTILAAVSPIPDNMSEYHFAGLLRDKRLELVKCKTVDLEVPANAEIIFEGYISDIEEMDEGPFGDHTGYYNEVEKFPVFNLTAITMRRDPIYLTTYTGHPPDEPSVLGEALNELFIPLLIQQFPEICDFYLPPEGCSYRVAVISMKKAYPGHAKRVMMGAWSFLRQFMYTKFIIVVDDDINIRDWKEIIWAISTRMDFARDTTIIENTPIDYLDFASPESGLGSKIGFDATNKIYPETKRQWGKKITMSQDIIDKINNNWKNYKINL